MDSHSQALKPGVHLNEFRIERLLGSGGFGLTYLAFDENLQKQVAIKEYLPTDFAVRSEGSTVIPRTGMNTEDFDWGLKAFLTEARILAKFDHPNIVRIHQLFEANGTAYIVMEYVEGKPLSNTIHELKQLTEAEVLSILEPLIDGLIQVHREGIYHRDIKPDNIIIRDNGVAVLIDFGAARQQLETRSRSMTSLVTAGYAPIEQYSSKGNLGVWTDIYALAAVAYTCLTGTRPDDAADRVLADEMSPAVQAAASQGRPEFLKAIDKGLAIRADDRPQALESWWEALTEGDESEQGPATPIHAIPREEIEKPESGTGIKVAKSPMVLWGVIGLLVLIVVVSGIAYMQVTDPILEPIPPIAVTTPPVLTVSEPAKVDASPQTKNEVTEQTAALGQLEIVTNVSQAQIFIDGTLVGKSPLATQSLPANEYQLTVAAAGYQLYRQRIIIESGKWQQIDVQLEAEPIIAQQPAIVPNLAEADNAEQITQQHQTAQTEQAMQAQAITEQLATCQAHLDANRLTTGRGGNAADCYESVLQQQPNNTQALVGITQIEAKYKRWAETALSQKKVDKAKSNITKIRSLNPESTALESLDEQLLALQEEQKEEARIEQARHEEAQRLAEEQAQAQARAQADRVASEQAAAARKRAQPKVIEPEMVEIKGGHFQMGGLSGEGHGREHPVHGVQVPSFWMGKYEVTFNQWDACVNAGGCYHRPDDEGWGRGNRPVINVNWNDMQEYIAWLNQQTGKHYRLPSEAEWEYAARAGSTTQYSWGDTISCSQARYGNYNKHCNSPSTVAIGSYRPNAWGLYDMHGNVGEWVADCWNDSYRGAPNDGSAWLAGNCIHHVYRGGSWGDYPRSLRSAFRYEEAWSNRNDDNGFRLALDK